VWLCVLWARAALSQGTVDYKLGYWELTFHPTNNTQAGISGQSQISLQVPGTEFDRNMNWTQEEITASLQVEDPFGNRWAFNPNGDVAGGQTQPDYSYSFYVDMMMVTPDGSLRSIIINAIHGHVQSLPPIPASGDVSIREFDDGVISRETGYWTAEQFVPEPSVGSLLLVGALVMVLKKRRGKISELCGGADRCG